MKEKEDLAKLRDLSHLNLVVGYTLISIFFAPFLRGQFAAIDQKIIPICTFRRLQVLK